MNRKSLFILFLLGCLLVQESRTQDDYFYDDSLSDEQIATQQRAKEASEAKAKEDKDRKLAEAKKEKPEWFVESQKPVDDPFKAIFEAKIKTYLDEYKKEQKRKMLENRSDLDHQLLSLLTLCVFFGMGSLSGVAVILKRGRRNGVSGIDSPLRKKKQLEAEKKMKKNTPPVSAYQPVAETDFPIVI